MCIIGFIIFPVAALEIKHEAIEETGENYKSRVDMQGDTVYEDASGYTEFALWLNGKNSYKWLWVSTRILVYIYYTVYYKIQYILPNPYTSYEWGTPPVDLIEWTGDWDYGHEHTQKWEWKVATSIKYCDGELWDDISGTGFYYSTYSQDGIYRYLGWINSFKSGDSHRFYALLRLHIDNIEAEKGDNGVIEENGYVKITYIEKIRVKLVFKFQYYNWGQWHHIVTHNHILGDGTPQLDLSNVLLVLGTMYGLQ